MEHKNRNKNKNNGHDQSLLTQFNNGAYLCDCRAAIAQFVFTLMN